MTADDNIIVNVGRTLIRPWKEDVSPVAAALVFVLFAIAVWWSLDSLNILSKMQRYIQEAQV